MKRYKIKLKAGISSPVPVVGNYIRLISGSGEVKVQIDTGQTLEGLVVGMAYSAVSFNNLHISSDTNQEIEFMAGIGRVEDNRTSINGAVEVIASGEEIAVINTVAGIVSGELLPQDGQRLSVIIINESPSETIYLGAAGVSVATGFKLRAGQSMTIDKAPRAAVHAVASVNDVPVQVFIESL